MIDSSWHIEEPVPDDTVTTNAPGVLVTLHFIRTALRRRWRVWAAAAAVGMLLGLVWTVAVPAQSTGTATLFLAHDPMTDPTQAMTTDVTLLDTRTLAAQVVGDLGLAVSPESFKGSVTATPIGSNVLVITVSAPDNQAALTRSRAMVSAFLKFRTEQLRAQSNALIDGYSRRVASLQKQADRLTKQYNSLAASGSGRSQAADVMAEKSQVNAEIGTFQQTIQDTTLKTNSIIAASHVLDPANVVPHGAKKRAALAMGSGMIAGTALGMGVVLFSALTSDRLRRRDEVSAALGAPVRVSVSTLQPRRPWYKRIPRRSGNRRDVQVLVHALESLAPSRKRTSHKTRASRVALATLDRADVGTADVATVVVAALAAQLTRRGLAVFLVDLSEAGHLDRVLADELSRDDDKSVHGAPPVVFRPDGIPFLARGPVGAHTGAVTDLGDQDRAAWDRADMVLTLAEVDPAIGAEHLASWTDDVVLVVAAGRSSAERLRSTAELVRSADLGLPFAMMVGADRTDESLGLPEALDADWAESGRSS